MVIKTTSKLLEFVQLPVTHMPKEWEHAQLLQAGLNGARTFVLARGGASEVLGQRTYRVNR